MKETCNTKNTCHKYINPFNDVSSPNRGGNRRCPRQVMIAKLNVSVGGKWLQHRPPVVGKVQLVGSAKSGCYSHPTWSVLRALKPNFRVSFELSSISHQLTRTGRGHQYYPILAGASSSIVIVLNSGSRHQPSDPSTDVMIASPRR